MRRVGLHVEHAQAGHRLEAVGNPLDDVGRRPSLILGIDSMTAMSVVFLSHLVRRHFGTAKAVPSGAFVTEGTLWGAKKLDLGAWGA